ncbi:MAG: hypothetical protein ABI905_12270 [Betaproteobacteria bacterium]
MKLHSLLATTRKKIFRCLLHAVPVFIALFATANALAALPVISTFTASRDNIISGNNVVLNWTTSGATIVSMDQGIGDVTGVNTFSVSPSATTRYTLTASNASGNVTASVQVNLIALQPLSATTWHTENAFFLIADPAQVTFPDWNSIYSTANVDSYIAQLNNAFPDDYMMVVVAANQLMPAAVPSVITRRHLATGIGQDSITGTGIANICRFHLGTSPNVSTGAFAVFDHEIGHNWGVQIGMQLGIGHWLKEGTVHGQMADNYFDAQFTTAQQINGDPVNGFTWTAIDNLLRNDSEIFSDQDLYAMGLNAVFPDAYVLANPVLNPDHSVSYSSVAKYDHAWVLNKHGPRVPGYQASEKQFRVGFVYVARDFAEIQSVYSGIEQSARHFANAEQIDTVRHRFQVPFLVETKFRGSVKSRLADLDGNTAPTLSLSGATYLTSSDGKASVPFAAADADGASPIVSLVSPLAASAGAAIGSGAVQLQGLANGTHFFTLKAEDSYGKKSFTHFVVDVAIPPVNLVDVTSPKNHGSAGIQSLLIAPSALSGAITVEPRQGLHMLVFSFDGPVITAGTVTAVDGAGAAITGVASYGSTNTVVVTLPSMADGTRAQVSVTGVNGSSVIHNAALGFLPGDINNSYAVNASDISSIKARDSAPINAMNFLFDVDTSGQIDAQDVIAAKARSGRTLP